MANRLQDRRIAILAADGVERVELQTPREAVQDAGGETELLSLKLGEIQARNNDLDSAGTFTVDRMVADASADVVDQEVVIDGNLISSRSPDDLPAFCRAIVDEFAKTPAAASGR
jgi:protease I